MQVLDYSAGFPGAAAIRNAGYVGAVRYIGLPGYTKCATRDELRDFSNHGIGMALVFEHFATDWRGGANAGRANMRRALDHAHGIGFPADSRPIYMAIDQDVVSADEFKISMDYLWGAAEVIGGRHKTGPYGEHDVCLRSAAEGFVWQWQCRAWSGTPPRMFGGRRLYQHVGTVRVGGIPCDVNEVDHGDWGQHSGGDDMAWNDQLTSHTGYAASAAEWLIMSNVKAEEARDAAQRCEALLSEINDKLGKGDELDDESREKLKKATSELKKVKATK